MTVGEDELRRDRPRYDDLVEHSFGLLCMHDLEGTLTWVNPAIAALLERERSEMIGRSLGDFLRDRSALQPYLAKVIENEEDQGWIEALTPEGEARYVQFHNVLMTEEDGTQFVLGHAQDVTALIVAENELQTAQDELGQVLQASPAMIYSAEAKPDYLVTYISPNVLSTPAIPKTSSNAGAFG